MTIMTTWSDIAVAVTYLAVWLAAGWKPPAHWRSARQMGEL